MKDIPHDQLEKLREEVRNVDREIMQLVGKRLDLTQQIGSLKKALGLPLLNYEVEKTVIENTRQIAEELNLSADFVKAVMQLLIAESRTQQERIHYSSYRGDKETVLIVGGQGEMGHWLANFFENQGHKVLIYDIREKPTEYRTVTSLEQGLAEATCVVVSVSLDVVPQIIAKITDSNFPGLIFDIASIKGHLTEIIRAAAHKGLMITSIHPMFGPNTRTLSDKVICFCDCGNPAALQRAREFFKETAVSGVDLSLENHDLAIAYVLGLSHLINIIFMNILSQSSFRYSELKAISSTTFLSQMLTASSVINEKPELYFLIQKYNPFKQLIYQRLEASMKAIVDCIVKDDSQTFVHSMLAARAWLNETENPKGSTR